MSTTTMGSISIVTKSHDDDGRRRRQFFKKAVTQFAISVSIFFFSVVVVVLLVYSRNMYSCSFDVISRRRLSFLHAVFSHTIDKKCVFLLCNGLLVFVAKSSINTTSSSSSSSSSSSHQHCYDNTVESRSPPPSLLGYESNDQVVEEIKEVVVVEDHSVVVGHDHQEQVEARGDEGEDQGKIVSKEKIQESDRDDVHDEEEEEEDDEEEGLEEEEEEGIDAVLSTEELNRKFDEFIRRMKEEIRVEAQRHCQLVLVK
ncbi:unnamed protein product [Linum trigynum]|uniref:Uncharacterized protein n=1 Tax=Linum trigynum TaxID=586398 RepID=A0AAV2EFL7_9ROSI